jgi:hypothetical protein
LIYASRCLRLVVELMLALLLLLLLLLEYAVDYMLVLLGCFWSASADGDAD